MRSVWWASEDGPVQMELLEDLGELSVIRRHDKVATLVVPSVDLAPSKLFCWLRLTDKDIDRQYKAVLAGEMEIEDIDTSSSREFADAYVCELVALFNTGQPTEEFENAVAKKIYAILKGEVGIQVVDTMKLITQDLKLRWEAEQNGLPAIPAAHEMN